MRVRIPFSSPGTSDGWFPLVAEYALQERLGARHDRLEKALRATAVALLITNE